jgi:hypothetical protein
MARTHLDSQATWILRRHGRADAVHLDEDFIASIERMQPLLLLLYS